MITKQDAAAIVIFLVVIIGIFYTLNSKIDTLDAKVNTESQALYGEVGKIRGFLDSSGVECEFVRHEIGETGVNVCARSHQFCLLSQGQMQEVFFSTSDGTCNSAGFPESTKDWDTRAYECATSIDDQTGGFYTQGRRDGRALCQRGGYLDTDFWNEMLNTGSYCCKYTSNGVAKEPGSVVG